METESEIAERVKQNIPQPAQAVPAPKQPIDTQFGRATTAVTMDFDELTLYKLHNFFGQTYAASDLDNVKRIKYIYGRIAEDIGNPDYPHVISKAADLMRKAGIANSDNRIYRLYQYLKLDNVKRGIETEMSALGGDYR